MILADLPSWLESTAQLAAAIGVIFGTTGLMLKSRPGRFVWAKFISEPLTEWNQRAAVDAINAKINGDLDHLAENVDHLMAGQAQLSTAHEDLAAQMADVKAQLALLLEGHEATYSWVRNHTDWAEHMSEDVQARIENANARIAALEAEELRRRENGP